MSPQFIYFHFSVPVQGKYSNIPIYKSFEIPTYQLKLMSTSGFSSSKSVGCGDAGFFSSSESKFTYIWFNISQESIDISVLSSTYESLENGRSLGAFSSGLHQVNNLNF